MNRRAFCIADHPRQQKWRFLDFTISLTNTKLQSILTKSAKMQVVVDWLVALFEPDRRYSEAEVNAVINQVHEDHATLRRLLVDYRLMERAGGIYWRV